MREVKDCRNELADFATALKATLTERSKSMPNLSECLDFGILFDGLCGERTTGEKSPVNRNEYARLGASSFLECIRFVSLLPHIKKVIRDEKVELGSAFSQQVLEIEKHYYTCDMGQHLENLFPIFFKKVMKLQLGDLKLCDITLAKGVSVTSFRKYNDKSFDLVGKYDVKLSDESSMKVVLQDEEVITAIYRNTQFYQSIGQEFCIVFDVMYAKVGTEAPAESHYRVMDNQEMDGGQDLSTLSMRVRIDSYFPTTIQCQRPKHIILEWRQGSKS